MFRILLNISHLDDLSVVQLPNTYFTKGSSLHCSATMLEDQIAKYGRLNSVVGGMVVYEKPCCQEFAFFDEIGATYDGVRAAIEYLLDQSVNCCRDSIDKADCILR